MLEQCVVPQTSEANVVALRIVKSTDYKNPAVDSKLGDGRKVAEKKITEKTVDQQISPEERKMLVLAHREEARCFAKNLLRRWKCYFELDELYSLVDMALCQAANGFSPVHGAKFSTYSYFYIKGVLVRAIRKRKNSSMLIVANVWDIDSEEEEMDERYGKEHGELSADNAFGGQLYKLRPDQLLFRKQLRGLGEAAYQGLEGLERAVIEKVYYQGCSMTEAAKQLGYSRCHLSRVRTRAIERLRQTLQPQAI